MGLSKEYGRLVILGLFAVLHRNEFAYSVFE